MAKAKVELTAKFKAALSALVKATSIDEARLCEFLAVEGPKLVDGDAAKEKGVWAAIAEHEGVSPSWVSRRVTLYRVVCGSWGFPVESLASALAGSKLYACSVYTGWIAPVKGKARMKQAPADALAAMESGSAAKLVKADADKSRKKPKGPKNDGESGTLVEAAHVTAAKTQAGLNLEGKTYAGALTEMLAMIEGLTKERDELRAQLGTVSAERDALRKAVDAKRVTRKGKAKGSTATA